MSPPAGLISEHTSSEEKSEKMQDMQDKGLDYKALAEKASKHQEDELSKLMDPKYMRKYRKELEAEERERGAVASYMAEIAQRQAKV